MQTKPDFFTGTSGLLLPVPNKECYPEAFKSKSRLRYYSSLFNSIEINSSFYKPPLATTVSKWAADTPVDFKFTFKLWRNISHNKGLAYSEQDISLFMERIAGAGEKKGCLLVQFPGSIKLAYLREMEQLLLKLKAANMEIKPWKVSVEFRDASWYQPDTYDLLETLNIGMVLHDKLRGEAMLQEVAADFVYLRFHGPNGSYRGSYEDHFLYEYASYVREWLSEGKQVYAYFNNTMGNAIQNLESLRNYILEN